MRCIDADNLIEELLDCPVDEEIALETAEEVGLKENDDAVIIDFWRRCKDSFVNFVKTEPTVDNTIEHGHWIYRTDGIFNGMYKCSVCRDTVSKPSRYCPYCGARMDDEVAE